MYSRPLVQPPEGEDASCDTNDERVLRMLLDAGCVDYEANAFVQAYHKRWRMWAWNPAKLARMTAAFAARHPDARAREKAARCMHLKANLARMDAFISTHATAGPGYDIVQLRHVQGTSHSPAAACANG